MWPFIKFMDLIGINKTLILGRMFNCIILLPFNQYLIYLVIRRNYGENADYSKIYRKTLILQHLPTIYFFNFLLYTDTASMSIILLAFVLMIYNRIKLSAIVSLFSILMRQTNAIWIIYICAYHHINNHSSFLTKNEIKEKMGILEFANLIFVKDLPNIIKKYIYHILVILSFGVFIIKNGSVVLGDKSNHEFNFHPTQLIYLHIFLLPNTLLSYGNIIKQIIRIFKEIFILKDFKIKLVFLILSGVSY